MPQMTAISQAEWDVIKVLWDKGPLTAGLGREVPVRIEPLISADANTARGPKPVAVSFATKLSSSPPNTKREL